MPVARTKAPSKVDLLPVEIAYKDFIDDGKNQHNILLKPEEELTKRELDIKKKLQKCKCVAWFPLANLT